MNQPRSLVLSLVSHTNVGKTTLARTWLRREVGEVLDQAHVTDETERFVLHETEAGDAVVLADTPGFGDSVRLLRRLEGRSNPLGWFLGEVWDRFNDRPLWCSQKAVAHVREEADLVLYLVNASEDPSEAGYVEPELKILGWIDRPVIVLLNQTGEAKSAAARAADEARWRALADEHDVVRGALSLDAFTRCWLQEGLLFDHIRALVPHAKRDLMERYLDEWRARSAATLRESVEVLAHAIGAAAADGEALGLYRLARLDRKRSGDALARRLEESVATATERLIELHGLRGEGAEDVRVRLGDVSAPSDPANPWQRSVLGGLVGGALGGLAADVAHGGLTFGGGAVAGAILGAAGLGGLSWAYRVLGSEAEPRMTWSPEFLDRQVRDAVLRYLAVAHAGRGAGEFRAREQPDFWRAAVERERDAHLPELHELWERAQRDSGEDAGREAGFELIEPLDAMIRAVLREFYPEAESLLASLPRGGAA